MAYKKSRDCVLPDVSAVYGKSAGNRVENGLFIEKRRIYCPIYRFLRPEPAFAHALRLGKVYDCGAISLRPMHDKFMHA
ncbi:MAG: hypothetical protein K8F25_09105 [Fimbriimonadaceae bacterium]|nr:hypothetical protein [Alphaproteobacteria bacterium]